MLVFQSPSWIFTRLLIFTHLLGIKITMGRNTKIETIYRTREVTRSIPNAWKRCPAFIPQVHSGTSEVGAAPPPKAAAKGPTLMIAGRREITEFIFKLGGGSATTAVGISGSGFTEAEEKNDDKELEAGGAGAAMAPVGLPTDARTADCAANHSLKLAMGIVVVLYWRCCKKCFFFFSQADGQKKRRKGKEKREASSISIEHHRTLAGNAACFAILFSFNCKRANLVRVC